MFHSIYFLSYAVMATATFGLVFFANYMRMRQEGSSIPRGIFRILLSISLIMWMGFGASYLYYNP